MVSIFRYRKNTAIPVFRGMIRHERGIDYITKLLTTTSNIECIIENGVIYLK